MRLTRTARGAAATRLELETEKAMVLDCWREREKREIDVRT